MKAGDIQCAVASGVLRPAAAINQLQKLGFDSADAGELVFIAVGGGDVLTTDAAGVRRYYGSGKSVDEVARLMSDQPPSRLRDGE